MMLKAFGILVLLLSCGCSQMNGKTQNWIDDGCFVHELQSQTYVCIDNERAMIRLEF